MGDLSTESGSQTGSDNLSGIAGFLKKLAGYYCQFLETDFKRIREPKRKFSERNGSMRVGIRLSRYPEFQELIVGKLNQKTLAPFQVRYGRYTARISAAAQAGIDAAIQSVDINLLNDQLQKIKSKYVQTAKNAGIDFELQAEKLEQDIRKILETTVVAEVIQVVKPSLMQSGGTAAENIETYVDEIVSSLYQDHRTGVQEAFGAIVYKKDDTLLEQEFSLIADEFLIKQTLSTYFSEFSARDVFVELREMISAHVLTENSQIYINVGELSDGRSAFPLYYIPAAVRIEAESIKIETAPLVYANKKAVEFVLGIQKANGLQTSTNPLDERIFHKSEEETHHDVIQKTFHKVLAAINVNGDVSIKSGGLEKASRGSVVVSNALSISLSDKSDESIVNDYEQLISGLDEGDPLLEKFTEIIESFLTTNPLAIDSIIDREWDETPTQDRLVFQSPLPLAEEQRKVLAAIRHDDSRFIIVEGPPGTGKSHTITAIAFELILKNKNILILSDKKEALDVVESKLNSVISKVRSPDSEFVNPILRLGKNDSNYSNIIKSSSINKLKTSVRTFRADEKRFDEHLKNEERQLKAHVIDTVHAVEDISFAEIDEFHRAENELFQKYELLESIDSSSDDQLLLLSEVMKLVNENRQLFANLAFKDGLLGDYLRLYGAMRTMPSAVRSVLDEYPSLNLDLVDRLSGIVEKIRSAKKPLVGYLFASSLIKEMSLQIQEVIGALENKPQNRLQEYQKLALVKNDIKSHMFAYGGIEDDIEQFVVFIREVGVLDEEYVSTLLKFDSAVWNADIREHMPHNLRLMLSANETTVSMLLDLNALIEKKKQLRTKFEKIPNFDYLKQKSQFERSNTLKLANKIDERVVKFAIDKKSDAKTLQKIIREKNKFPVELFGVLREAFPCMIAGLRDFAEFIPLESDLFDLVIIDEASQVSIAQAMPAILRAKKVLVLGDRRQFGNVKTANASKQINAAYFNDVMEFFRSEIARDDISQTTRLKNFNITHSVMDFFELNNNFTIQLRKHFRGYPEMISFSSKYVYSEGLQALKIRGKPIEDVLEFRFVEDLDRIETIRNANRQEAELILRDLRALLQIDEPPTVAIITPFRDQVTLLQGMLQDDPQSELMHEKLKLAVFTFDTCQGEERDIIYYSMVANRANDGLNFIFPVDLKVSEDEVDGSLKFQRLNVGFSRGKEKLIFVLSKNVEEFRGSARLVLKHYQDTLSSAKKLPGSESVDPSSPMEKKVLEWLKSTSFVTSRLDAIEIIPQFELGLYLKSLDPSYVHPNYKVDFLLRLRVGDSVYQCVVEYDGFEYHFQNREHVNAANWRSYLTSGDVERECVLESYGYKMIRVNRFNLGKDPVSALDERLRETFDEFDSVAEMHPTVAGIVESSASNIAGLEAGTHRHCSKCGVIKPLESFLDKSLKSQYGRFCASCKTGQRRSRFI